MYNLISNIQICYFDIPHLLYYSHIPTAVICLILGIFVFTNNRKLFASRLLLVIGILFSIWVASDIIIWVSPDSRMVMFFWSIVNLVEISISMAVLYFAYSFLDKKTPPFWAKLLFGFILLSFAVLIPTQLNLYGFNVANCESQQGPLINYFYFIEVFNFLFLFTYLIRKMVKSVKPKRSQVMLFAIGVLFFSFSFSGSNLIGSIASLVNPDNPDNWKILQYGLFGMPVFMAFLVYMIVKFRAFSVKLIGAQALVVSLVIVIGSEFFFIQNSTNQILVAITLILTGFIGLNLIHSVKKEIEQREKIEMLAEQLKSLVHFISHEVKGALGKGRAVFGGILEGDYGDVPVEVKDIVKVADKDTKKAVDMVMNILSSSDLKNGKMKMDMKPFDMKTSVLEIVSDLKADAEEKGLSVETNIPEGADFTVVGDQDQIAKHVVRNLIDNSIRYTPTGGLKVALLRTDGRVIFSFKDTGVGITPEDKTHLFTEGGRGKDSVKVNVSSTGYGLYFAKGIVEANGGKIWVESEGQGKGSTFFVEFPAKK